MTLVVDWCDYKAATYAVKKWHYSGTMPVSKRVFMGAWEDGDFIGAVVYALGSSPTLGNPYGLKQFECCELVRVALRSHNAPTSQIVAKTTKMLKGQSPGLRLIVSFADPYHDHHGGIYQAMNWIYAGMTHEVKTWELNGKVLHRRAYTGINYGSSRLKVPKGAKEIVLPPKHRYLYPLDRAMRRQIEPLAQPYPKREQHANVG